MFNVLVVPSGTEIAHEIVRSLKNLKNVVVYGANSIDTFTEIEIKKNINNIPDINDDDFISSIDSIVNEFNISHVFPAHDSASLKLTKYADSLNAKIVSSSYETNKIARSKKVTYKILKDVVNVPALFTQDEELNYPLFVKPDIGQGSVGAYSIHSKNELINVNFNDIICEFLPGDEYTVDCITDANNNLLDVSPRKRELTRNGIAVTTALVQNKKEFIDFAKNINSVIKLKGAWFFQVKRNFDNQLCLLEIATRISGSMITSRFNGINYAEASLYISDGLSISTLNNNLDVKLYRNLSYQFSTNLQYDSIYSDFDDCLIIHGKVNIDLIKLFFQAKNDGKEIILITRHDGDLLGKLKEYCLENLFDNIIHITNGKLKSDYIEPEMSIFIDDSFRERQDVSNVHNIPCFSVDMIGSLTCLRN